MRTRTHTHAHVQTNKQTNVKIIKKLFFVESSSSYFKVFYNKFFVFVCAYVRVFEGKRIFKSHTINGGGSFIISLSLSLF